MQSWTVYSQQNIPDSTETYNLPIWRAWRIVRDLKAYEKCDSLVEIQEKQLIQADSVINIGNEIIQKQDTIIQKQEEKYQILEYKQEDLNKKHKKKIIKWVSISGIELLIIILLII